MMNANFLFDPELLHFTQVRNKLCVCVCVCAHTTLRMRNLIATNIQPEEQQQYPHLLLLLLLLPLKPPTAVKHSR